MRRSLLSATIAALLLSSPSALAESAESSPGDAPREREEVSGELPRLILDTGRRTPPPADPDTIRFTLHGEDQIRYQLQSEFPLTPTVSAIVRTPGITEDSIGQAQSLTHWLRITPRLQIQETIEVVGQLDVLTGLVAGERTHDVGADATPRDDYNGFSNIQARWLYAQLRLPFGVLRVGQQPNHWGMGLVANDGDHPTLFGDYRYGAISERILFGTRPGGVDSPVTVAIAGDIVYRDANAHLTRGDHAYQGVIAGFYERGPNRFGIFSTYRRQENDRTSGTPLFSYTDEIDALAVDLHGKFATPMRADDTFLYGEAELAYITGKTNVLRTPEQALAGEKTDLRSYGGAAVLGVVHKSVSTGVCACNKNPNEETINDASARYFGHAHPGGIPFGDLVAQIEIGYASGDADPYDKTSKRFVIDANHKIGLLMFDEVLRWQTARSATAAMDPLLANSQRSAPGVDLLPSNGGVFGAQYINPTFIARPRHWLDLKGGAVIAQTTADFVDPYRLATSGSYQNYRGGNPKKRDLGVELDAGIEARIPLDYDLLAQVGAQGGLLFPGGALENSAGERLPTQWIAIGRLGLQF